MKVAPLLEALHAKSDRVRELQPFLIHTGQHYDSQMSDGFFRDLRMPMPDVYLGTGSGSHGEQTAGVMVTLENGLRRASARVGGGCRRCEFNPCLCNLGQKTGYPGRSCGGRPPVARHEYAGRNQPPVYRCY